MDTLTVERPWGKFELFTANQQCSVKILTIKPYSSISLQYHNHREEFWHIVVGSAKITIGDKTLQAKAGDEFFIPKKTNHRIETQNETLKVLEIMYGKFDEEDNVRLEDKYGRVKK
ncbi:phosphomannose isomerase type II C-terminal cupin domain [Candidatus Woesearchaeota archaeon]|nr:phosphomannose isomerase type II C-terminal cupin domain [Candidatus Woesearchaeota archaeon]